jgi:hypothetical protein
MFRAFFKNQGSTWTDQPSPAGGLGDLLGVRLDGFYSIPPIPAVGLRSPRETAMDWNDERGTFAVEVTSDASGFHLPASTRIRYHTWAETYILTTADAVMRYGDGFYKGGVAAARNSVGQGKAYTIGFWGDTVIPRPIYDALGLKQFERPERDSHGTIEVMRLEGDNQHALEIRLNHYRNTASLSFD